MSHQKCCYFTKIIFAIVLLLSVDQGLSLKCYQCDSAKDGDCMDKLTDTLNTECGKDSGTTTVQPSTTTAVPTSTTAQPTSTTAEPTTTTAQPTTTTAQPTTTTAQPTTTTAQPTTTTAQPTTTTTAPPASTTTQRTNDQPQQNGEVFAKRVRRSSNPISRAEDDYVCYTEEYVDGETTKTRRGCTTDKKHCEGKKQCTTCEKDGCNSASSAKLRVWTIIVSILFTFITSLNR